MAAGTRQSENASSWVSDADQPTFEYFGATVNPGVPDGTTMVEISGRRPAGRAVIAVTVTNDVMSVPEFVMNAFVPSITQSSPSRRAVVRVAPASVPPPGSVRPNAPSARPAQRSGSHRARCSSVPNR